MLTKIRTSKLSKEQELLNSLTEIKRFEDTLDKEFYQVLFKWYYERAKFSLLGFSSSHLDKHILFEPNVGEVEMASKPADFHKVRNTLNTYTKSKKYGDILTLRKLIELHYHALVYLEYGKEKPEIKQVLNEEFQFASTDVDLESLLRKDIYGYDDLDSISKATSMLEFIISANMFKKCNKETARIAMNFILIRDGYFGTPIHFSKDKKFDRKISTIGLKKPNREIVTDYLNYFTSEFHLRLTAKKEALTSDKKKTPLTYTPTTDTALLLDIILSFFKR